jgi:hypothetical protein
LVIVDYCYVFVAFVEPVAPVNFKAKLLNPDKNPLLVLAP